MKRTAALGLTALIATLAAAPAGAQSDAHATEAQIGQQEAQILQQKGEIIPRPNALYATLDPIAQRIAAVADPQYDFPFRFTLVHEAQPNAFAVPGGNVYVTDSLMKFVQNKEELAGVLCHETSHDIHHDVLNNAQKNQTTAGIIGIVGALTGLSNSGIGQVAESGVYTLQSDSFSRAVEHNADAKGAMTCAQAGFNPWGMVWLFQNFEKANTGGSMEALSDHPTDDHRIADLEAEFRANPQIFGRFKSDIAYATPLSTSNNPSRTGYASSRRYTQPVRHAAAERSQTPSRYCCSPASNTQPVRAATAAPASDPTVTVIQGH